jgi:hypothetical protein
MATIALYASKVNQMPGLIQDVKLSVGKYKAELSALQKKSLSINKSVCNMDDVISSVQASSQTQEQKIASLDAINKSFEDFVANVVRIDGEVADLINQRKNEFYDKYNHLKPECEKSGWEKFCNGLKKVGEWCKEHWVMIVTVIVVIAIAILAVVTFGAAIAAVAAVAGLVSLALYAADGICMLATGGKNLATVFRENGWNVLADIFQGLQVGCDIVSIVFPASAAIKLMAKTGVKIFAKAAFNSAKTALRETMESVFKSGFGKGIINLSKTAFKTFIFDFGDLVRIGSGGRSALLHNANKYNTRFSNKVNNNIISQREADIYKKAGLRETEVSGKKALIRDDIDFNNPENVKRLNGKPPQSPVNNNGDVIELHHIGQKPDSPLAELTFAEHQQGGNKMILHDTSSGYQSKINRNAFTQEKRAYWNSRKNGT